MLYPFFLSLAGDISEEATPDPIPNSEVKLFCVDGTAWVTAWESRTSPAFFVFLACTRAGFDRNMAIDINERRAFARLYT